MLTAKVAISIDDQLLKEVDLLVKEKIIRMNNNRLARECAKLDVDFEQSLAEEGFNQEIESWSEY